MESVNERWRHVDGKRIELHVRELEGKIPSQGSAYNGEECKVRVHSQGNDLLETVPYSY